MSKGSSYYTPTACTPFTYPRESHVTEEIILSLDNGMKGLQLPSFIHVSLEGKAFVIEISNEKERFVKLWLSKMADDVLSISENVRGGYCLT